MPGSGLAKVVNARNGWGLTESFAAQLFAGFNVRRLLPFAELPVKRVFLEPKAVSPFPFPARAGEFPAGRAQVQQAGVAPANRFRGVAHAVIIAPAARQGKRKNLDPRMAPIIVGSAGCLKRQPVHPLPDCVMVAQQTLNLFV